MILSTKSLRAQLYNGKFHEGAYPRVLTGADGRFSFPAQTEPFRVFVDHESGFAEADEKTLAGSSHLTIQPWGRIEGTVKIGTRPAAGVQIRLSETDNRWAPDEAMPITQAQQLNTDARGRYAFERVIPARLSVSRIFTLERSSFHVGTGCARTVTVKPDRTTWVDLGGTGRPVVGRFALPAGIKAGAVFPYHNQTLERIRPEPPYPVNLSGKEREAWLTEWLATDEGEAYSGSECTFDTNVRPDGRFRIEDVPAGKYQLHAEMREPGNGVPGTYGPVLASIDTEIIVPEIARRPVRRAAGRRHDRAQAIQAAGSRLITFRQRRLNCPAKPLSETCCAARSWIAESAVGSVASTSSGSRPARRRPPLPPVRSQVHQSTTAHWRSGRDRP